MCVHVKLNHFPMNLQRIQFSKPTMPWDETENVSADLMKKNLQRKEKKRISLWIVLKLYIGLFLRLFI